MSDDVKQLDDMTAAQLRDYAAASGVNVPNDITDKRSLRFIIEMANRPVGDHVGQADASTEEVVDNGDGTESASRVITDVRANGDWRDPFTGSLVWHGQDTNPETRGRVKRQGAGRKNRKDDTGHLFVPVKAGDLVIVERPAMEED